MKAKCDEALSTTDLRPRWRTRQCSISPHRWSNFIRLLRGTSEDVEGESIERKSENLERPPETENSKLLERTANYTETESSKLLEIIM